MVSLFLWQPSAEMQDKKEKEDSSVAEPLARIDENSPIQNIKEDISYAPQAIVYTTSTMTGQTIVPGTTNIGNNGDDVTTAITIPFSFNFYGNPFTAANVSSNGNLQFTSNSTAFSNVCPLPTTTLNNPIMPYWDDLDTRVASNPANGIFTSVSGSAPNRIFNIEWRTTTFNTPVTPVNFEIRLYETTGQIDFIYAAVAGGGNSATVGVQNGMGDGPFGGAFNFTQFSCNQANLSAGLKVTFTPSDVATPTPTPTPTPIPGNQQIAYSTTLRFPGGGVTENRLISYALNAPGVILSDVPVGGLNTALAEYMSSIDFRPATGQMYGLIVQNNAAAGAMGTIRLVTVDIATGNTTPV
ncbi:MAG: DUF4394 domain-containing protein, partial [Acidobacteriota bacterium]|nr:DUF4394 domain-containing protein [Acidobacteriota bacterium]